MSGLFSFFRNIENPLNTNIANPHSNICIIGGLQFIGAHIALEFARCNYRVIIVDTVQPTNFIHPSCFMEQFKNIEFIANDLTKSDPLKDIFVEKNIQTIIYPFRNSFSFKDTLTIYSNIIYPLTNVLKAISDSNIISNNQIKKILCASTFYHSPSNEMIYYLNYEYPIHQPALLTYLKEKCIYEFHKMNPNVSTNILKITTPCGVDPFFSEQLFNIHYLYQHKSLQNNIIYSILTDNLLQINKNRDHTIKNSTNGYTDNVNCIDISDISRAFLDVQEKPFQGQFNVFYILQFEETNILNIIKIFGSKIRFVLGHSESPINNKTYSEYNLIQYTKDKINWLPKKSFKDSFERIKNILGDRKHSMPFLAIDQIVPNEIAPADNDILNSDIDNEVDLFFESEDQS